MADQPLLGKRAILALVLLFGATAIYTMPARLLVSGLGLSSSGVYIQGASGYWHSGKAALLQVNIREHAIQLQAVDWNLKFSHLLMGKISCSISGKFSGRVFAATVSRSVFGSTSVSDLSAMVNADDVRPLLNNLIVPLNGWLELRNVSLEHDGDWFTAIDGVARLGQLSASVPMGELTIGNFDLELSQADGDQKPLRAEMTNYSGQFGLSGDAQLQSDYSYELGLVSEPDGTVEPMLLQQMGMLFGPPSDGRYMFEYSAKL